MKTCCVCKEIKELDCFYRDKRRLDGLQTTCRDCKRLLAQKRHASNPKYHSEMSKKWRKENPEKEKASTKSWKKKTGYRKRYYNENYDKVLGFRSYAKKVLVKMGIPNPTEEQIQERLMLQKIKRLTNEKSRQINAQRNNGQFDLLLQRVDAA